MPGGHEAKNEELLVEAGVFIAWYKRTAPVLASRRHELPALYQVWLHRPGKAGRVDRIGQAVYFEAGGEEYSVFASLSPTILARKLPAGWLREKLLPAMKQSTGFAQTVIPRLEEQSPGSRLRAADIDGNIPISPQGFEDLFDGSDVELEALPFAQVFGRELRDLAIAATHAKLCGRPLHLHHV
ncbi:MAG TPA: hypothetical protein VKQ32_27285 [Polyangia bacterium]|nr:hypothetical protein [Polyangia bacterium]